MVIHDSLAFLILTVATAVLFAVTLFLFRSFAAHRADLARQFSEQGRAALSQGHPIEAVAALRKALSYASANREDELLLAQALGDAGHLDESTNYFLNLWESQPGDGFINLQLARLARRKQEKQTAIDYYRASIFGSWNGDGVVRRREVRLELADYLITIKDLAAAQAELLIAASNSPRDPAIEIELGDALLRAGDAANASREYQKAFSDDPRSAVAYAKAGRIAYQLGDYARAQEWLERAVRGNSGAPSTTAGSPEEDLTLLRNAGRILAIDPDRAETTGAKTARLLSSRDTARKRLDTCAQQLTAGSSEPIQALNARWASSSKFITRAALMREPANQLLLKHLIDDTEIETARLCGQPNGDDALLLTLASRGQPQ